MNFRRLVFGINAKDMAGMTPLQFAIEYGKQSETQLTVIGLVVCVLLIGGGFAVMNHFATMDQIVPVAGLVISFLAIVAIRLAIMLPLVQIKQNDNASAENVALRKAIEELTVEMRRRPEPLSAPVNLALFNLTKTQQR